MTDKKQISSILKDAAVLFLITLIAAVLLGFVNEVTKGPIQREIEKAKAAAYQKVFAEAAKIVTEDEGLQAKLEGAGAFLKDASLDGVTIDEAGIVKDSADGLLGYVMTLTSPNGYNGDITITMGYTAGRRVTRIEFITLNETAGFGLRAKEAAYMDQFQDIEGAGPLQYAADDGRGRTLDGISGATITSKAVLEAVNAGILFAEDLLESGIGGMKE